MPGRPPHNPTPSSRRRVAICAGAGMSRSEIALALAIDRKTLTKHYRDELAFGAYRCRTEILEALFASGKKGNAAAARAYLQLAPAGAPLLPPKPPKAEPLGKKAAANEAAKTAEVGTSWHELLRPH